MMNILTISLSTYQVTNFKRQSQTVTPSSNVPRMIEADLTSAFKYQNSDIDLEFQGLTKISNYVANILFLKKQMKF